MKIKSCRLQSIHYAELVFSQKQDHPTSSNAILCGIGRQSCHPIFPNHLLFVLTVSVGLSMLDQFVSLSITFFCCFLICTLPAIIFVFSQFTPMAQKKKKRGLLFMKFLCPICISRLAQKGMKHKSVKITAVDRKGLSKSTL